MSDLISIVIPAYNVEGQLGGCLDSLLAQTYTELEIVVVNDGSKDGTASVMDTYAAKEPRIKAIHKENGGVTSARLCGAAASTGEWIGFIDGDDVVEPYMFERLLQNAKTYNAQISHCGYQMVFPDGKVDYYYNTGRLIEQDTEAALAALITGDYIEPCLCNKLFRKELFKGLLEDHVLDTSVKTNEDLLMNYYLFKEAAHTVYEDVCPYHYVLRKGSAATSKLNEFKLKDPLKVLDILFEQTASRPHVQAAVGYRKAHQLIRVATMGCNGQQELIVPYRRDIRKRLRKEWASICRNPACNAKLKLMATWAAIWPTSYQWVHQIHGELSGSAHKFDV